ncbi:MAG: response regulator [Polyangiaceae bacterium]
MDVVHASELIDALPAALDIASQRTMMHAKPMKTVLVVEDTEDLRELFMEVLRRAGYGVVAAENGQAALEVLDTLAESPCLVLLDLMMPVMDGATFLKILREKRAAVTPPVVVVSATIGVGGVTGVAGLLRKPVASSVLLDVVRDCCGPP